jgi:hypothetical protein
MDGEAGSYYDRLKGRVRVLRGTDGRFGCPHCEHRTKRFKNLADHTKYVCKAVEATLASMGRFDLVEVIYLA